MAIRYACCLHVMRVCAVWYLTFGWSNSPLRNPNRTTIFICLSGVNNYCAVIFYIFRDWRLVKLVFASVRCVHYACAYNIACAFVPLQVSSRMCDCVYFIFYVVFNSVIMYVYGLLCWPHHDDQQKDQLQPSIRSTTNVLYLCAMCVYNHLIYDKFFLFTYPLCSVAGTLFMRNLFSDLLIIITFSSYIHENVVYTMNYARPERKPTENSSSILWLWLLLLSFVLRRCFACN